ncbi:MAG: cupin domain-containing protein [Micrococcales bacterium]|nr:cupin domain-containing protein [Micrococcales bacterium]
MTEMAVIPRDEIAGALAPAGVRAGADSGDPLVGLRQVAPAAGGNVGISECQPGGWPVIDRPDAEVAFILSGRADIRDDETGVTHLVTAGDLVVLPPGWSGRWDVRETVRKVYVIY